MHYQHFTAEDFVADAYFRKWVFDPDQPTQAFWSQWLQEHQEKRAEVEQARQIFRSLRFNYYRASQEDFQEVWDQIQVRRITGMPLGADQQVHSPNHWLWWRAAAAVGVVAILLYVLVYPWHYQTYITAYGQKKTIVLPDETEVVINANSELKFDQHWQQNKKRQVWLQGEAFFHVHQVKGADGKPIPFLVHTAELEVEVLGTEFNVHTRRGETKVVLNSGKVKLNLQKQQKEPLYLQPGEMVEVSQDVEAIIRKQVKAEEHIAWLDHWLVFEAASLAEVKTVLEDQYGYKVLMEEELAARRFTGRFPADKLDLLLQAIEVSLAISVRRDKERILIQSK